MKTKIFAITTLAVLLVLGIGGVLRDAWANQSPKDNPGNEQPNSGMMGGGMMHGGMMSQSAGQNQTMMGGGMSGMMGQMREHHVQMIGLMNKLMESIAAIQSEKDPDALKSKLAEHAKLLEQMHSQMTQQGSRMKMMSGQMTPPCPAVPDNSKPAAK